MHRFAGMLHLLPNAALLILGAVIACTIGEVGLRLLAGPSASAAVAPAADPDPGSAHMRPEQRTGWMLREGTRREAKTVDGEPFVLTVNSTGQRGAEVGRRSGPAQRRILFLGDSFTMAEAVPAADTFVQRVADLLNDDRNGRIQAINGGVPGYGTYQQLAYYRYYGRPLEPDVVVLCFFLGNDFRDNMISSRQGRLLNPILIPNWRDYAQRHEEPFLRQRGSRDEILVDPLTAQPLRVPSLAWVEFLEQESYLARLVGSRWDKLAGRWNGNVGLLDTRHRYYFYEIGLYQRLGDELLRTAGELTADCIRQLHQLVVEDGAEFALVLLPSQSQVDGEFWLQSLETLGLHESALGSLDMRYPNRLLADLCAAEDILFCDLTDAFAEAEDSGSLFLTAAGDPHFSIPGHRLVAKVIADFLNERSGLLDSPAVGPLRAGTRYMALGELAKAEQALKAGMRHNPDWAALHLALGEVYLRSQAWPRAEVAFRRSIEIDPEVVGGWEGLARALTAKAALGEAVRTYRQALEIRPGWWPYYEALRDLYRELNMASEAGESERQMAALFDSVPNAGRYWWVEHMSRGVQLQAKGSLSAAAREFARAAHFLPDKPAMEMLQRLEE